MRLTIDKLRAGVLLGGGALVLALLLVLGWAHFRARGVLRELPAQLGADIQREANGFTYSQTLGGRVVYTLHAKRATQRTGGTAQLEDAGLVLYGNGDGRADRIYGRNFLYNQSAGIVKAVGTVQLDLAAPAPASTAERIGFASGGAVPTRRTAGGKEQEPIHATTSGLSYQQSTGVATTVEHVAFRYDGMEGESEGATYTSGDGVLTLERDVRMHEVVRGQRATLTAEHAVMNRAAGWVSLQQATISMEGKKPDEAEEVKAATMLLRLGEGNKLRQVEGGGGVELADGDGRARAPRGLLQLTGDGEPAGLHLWDGVAFERGGVGEGKTLHGTARESESAFNARGQLKTERLIGDAEVYVDEADGTRRTLTGEHVEMEVAGGRALEQATAEGRATLRSAGGKDGGESGMSADRLRAEFGGEGSTLKRVTGFGSAMLQRVQAGLTETSHAPIVVAEFRPVSEGQDGRRTMGQAELATVQESGGVVLEREIRHAQGGSQRGGPEVERTHATAKEASYDATGGQGVLTGDVVVREPDRLMKADRVVLHEKAGDAEAEGNVQASLKPEAGQDGKADTAMVHVVGSRLLSQRSEGRVTILGGGGRDARMWQGASQVEAPVLVLRQAEGTMDAYGESGGTGLVVKTILVSSPQHGGATTAGAPEKTDVVRVLSGRLHFVNGGRLGDGERQTSKQGQRRAEFSDGVRLESKEGVVQALRAVALLRGEGGDERGSPPGSLRMGGGVERVVADGNVALEAPERKATGAELVWTAATQMFVLTGTPAAPPTVTDAANGTVTGGEIRLHSGDNSVEVVGASPRDAGGRVHTDTRLGKKG